jgi:tripartite-type tricarboxylate transporter receptor subunit TctC
MKAMEAPQRIVFVSAVATTLMAVAASSAHSQSSFPSRPIRLVVPAIAGSQADTVARMIAQKMNESWGQAVVIDNRAGAGGIIAASIVAKAAPDGHTLLFTLPNFAISAVLQPGLPYDPLKDFAAASHLGYATNVLVASPALGVKSVAELTAFAKGQPGRLVFASGSAGSAGHLSALRFCLAAQIKVIHVSFKGVPEATIEVLAGRASLHLGTLGVNLPFIKEGKLTALAVRRRPATSQTRPPLPGSSAPAPAR